MGFNEGQDQIQANSTVASPRLRLNKTTPLTLSTTFQRVDLSGTSAGGFNVNTFNMPPGSSNPNVWYDTTNKLIMFNNTADRNYSYAANFDTSTTNVISTLLGFTTALLRMRFVIPSPTPTYFPYPDATSPYAELGDLGLVSTKRLSKADFLYANAAIRQYGIGLEIAISNTYVGTATVNSVDFILYGLS